MNGGHDPSLHRLREQAVVDHVRRLLEEGRIGFPLGSRPAPGVSVVVTESDDEVGLKRLMAEVDVCDRSLQARMPVRRRLIARATRRWLFFFHRQAGAMHVACFTPWRELLSGGQPPPMSAGDLATEISRATAETGGDAVLVVASTSGFSQEARMMARAADGRALVLLWPAETGGWAMEHPPRLAGLAQLLDPEPEAAKRRRIDECIARHKADIIGGGLAAGRIAQETALPLPLVEDEMQVFARRSPDIAALPCEGTMMLVCQSHTDGGRRDGGPTMPFGDMIRKMLGRKEPIERQIARYTERRAALSVRRDRLYDDMAALEQKESELREQFKSSRNDLTKRRITSQLVQIRKDIERRQQSLSMLSQQIDVISTHVHNLELIQQGREAELPRSEELAEQQAEAERAMAELQADAEAAGAIAAPGMTGMSEEERKLYDELEAEARAESGKRQETAKAAPPPSGLAQAAPGGTRTAGEPAHERPEPPEPRSRRETEDEGDSEPAAG